MSVKTGPTGKSSANSSVIGQLKEGKTNLCCQVLMRCTIERKRSKNIFNVLHVDIRTKSRRIKVIIVYNETPSSTRLGHLVHLKK